MLFFSLSLLLRALFSNRLFCFLLFQWMSHCEAVHFYRVSAVCRTEENDQNRVLALVFRVTHPVKTIYVYLLWPLFYAFSPTHSLISVSQDSTHSRRWKMRVEGGKRGGKDCEGIVHCEGRSDNWLAMHPLQNILETTECNIASHKNCVKFLSELLFCTKTVVHFYVFVWV